MLLNFVVENGSQTESVQSCIFHFVSGRLGSGWVVSTTLMDPRPTQRCVRFTTQCRRVTRRRWQRQQGARSVIWQQRVAGGPGKCVTHLATK